MNSKADNRNMEIQRTRRPAARGNARLWQVVLAAATAALGGCTPPRHGGFIPPAPTAVVADAEPAPSAASQENLATILKKMEAAYDKIKDYRTEVETVVFEKDGSFKTEKSVYTFKKPKWIRLDLVSPHPGMIMVYPDRNGKVLVRPRGLLSKLRFQLMLDDPLLDNPSRQRVNQTDLGTLITNIGHSVTDQRRGPVSLSEDEHSIRIQVLADDHFREGIETRYRFLISKELWLPIEVDQSTANGVQVGRTIFRNLRTNINVPVGLFEEAG